MKLVLLFGLGCLPLVSSFAGDSEGKLGVEEIVSRALAANPMLKASAAKWAAMKERVPQAKAWDDPMVGVDFERAGTTRLRTYSDAEWMASRCLEITKKVQIASYRLAADPTETASPKSVTAPSNRKQS